MKNRLVKYFSVITLGLLAIAVSNCTVNVADGGTEAGNAKITGVIVDNKGEPVENALATLSEKTDSVFLSRDINPAYDTSVYTNAKGEYAFNLPDSGLYCIIVEKFDRYLVFIDSIHVKDTNSISVRPDTVKAPGSVTGTVFLEDTAGIANKNIHIASKEFKDVVTTVTHGEKFTISDLPEGFYGLFLKAESGEFIPTWIKIEILPDSSQDIGNITLKKLSNLLLSSNVMTADLNGLTDVAVDIEPEYTFSATPANVTAKVFVYPKGMYIIADPYIEGDKVIIKHMEDFPSGKEIGVYLEVKFDNGDGVLLDFTSDDEKRFTTK